MPSWRVCGFLIHASTQSAHQLKWSIALFTGRRPLRHVLRQMDRQRDHTRAIFAGMATPTEAASVGAVGAILLAALKLDFRPFVRVFTPVVARTTQVTSMIFLILIGATLFSLVFRGLGGDDLVQRGLLNLPGGSAAAVMLVMAAVFLLGFVMDAFEIIFVIVPIADAREQWVAKDNMLRTILASGAAALTHSYPYEEINEYLRTYPERESAIRATLNYFDGINFAPRIRCPMLVYIGLNDDVCPPETGHALYSAMTCPKELHAYPRCAHDSGAYWEMKNVEAFLAQHLRPAATQRRAEMTVG